MFAMKIKRTVVICILCSCHFSEVFGCVYNVRDVGFVEIVPAPYHLYCFIQDDTPEELISTFKQISNATLMDSNVEVEIVNTDRQKDHPAMEYFHFWEIQSFPSAILVSPGGRSLVLPVSIPNKPFKETVWSSLESVASSPKVKEILEHIVKAYCVVLLIEGEDAAENKRVHEAVTDPIRKIAGIMKQLPKRIDEPPYTIVIPQESVSQERILLWSLGVGEDELGEPSVAVLYGRGRRIGPLLEGGQITSSGVFNILSVIGLSCNCGLDKRGMMGTQIPLKWGAEIQSDVIKSLGFDAENPMVKMEMNSIISSGLFTMTEDKGNIGSSVSAFDRYSEEVLALESISTISKVSPAQLRELASTGSATFKSGLNLKTLLALMGIIILLILSGGIIILMRTRRRIS